MKRYIKSLSVFFAAITVMFSMTGCSDSFLDQTPDERVELTTVDQVIQLLATAYPQGNYGWLCEISSDNIIDINAPFLATQSNGSEVLVHYNLNSYERMDDEAYRFEPIKSSTGSDSPSTIWENMYQAIAVTNHALAILDEIKVKQGITDDDQMSEQMKAAYAEAYLARAYAHFLLVNIFSQAYKNEEASKKDIGIPYVTEAENVVLKDYDRSNVTDTYVKIGEDLEKGLAWVNDVNYTMPKWHFNVHAAHAFAARYYLYKRDYEKVIAHADAVLGTDPVALPSMLMDYSKFDDCTSSTDYAEIWQSPYTNDNIMLMATYSVQWRRSVGCRYATAGKALRDIVFHLGPNWNWYLMPACGVGGGTFYDGTSDHGFASSRIAERFEYSDKVAGIGYPHIIRREFTCTELLLERAEAKLLKANPDIDGAVNDMIAYEASRQSFSEENKAFYFTAMQPLTKELIEKWYTNLRHSNVFENWDFTQNMSPDFIVPKECVVYMNCLNDMRRYDTAYSGLRFFDLKRFGIEYSHVYSIDAIEYKLTWNDPRRAIEVPQEVLAAGLPSSRPEVPLVSKPSPEMRFTGNMIAEK